jgi:hydrogenase-4 component E
VIRLLLSYALTGVIALSFFVVGSRQLSRAIKALALQAFMLAAVALLASTQSTHPQHFWVLAAVTAAIKGVAVPVALQKAAAKLQITNQIETVVGIPSSLVVAGLATLGAFGVAHRLFGDQALALPGALATGLATIMLGLLVMLGRKKLITQIAGLLIMENGVILATLGLTGGMPLIVEIGVALDVLVAIQILAMFAYRISGKISSGSSGEQTQP